MSAEAVTSRLKLVSELRRLCLKLGFAKVRPREDRKTQNGQQPQDQRRKPRE
jgi:nucleoside 2-deoxyribosyltransferase